MEGNEKMSAKVIPRCLEWRDLHNRLRSPMQSIDERQGLLVQVKWAAREAGCDLKREVADLIYREASMLDRGMPEESLAGLRRNLASLFLEVIETQEKKQREEQKQAEKEGAVRIQKGGATTAVSFGGWCKDGGEVTRVPPHRELNGRAEKRINGIVEKMGDEMVNGPKEITEVEDATVKEYCETEKRKRKKERERETRRGI